ncbi:hypothetical protein BC938DRAFT_483893 [Jimgerdemannia flammicorona]|uniref:Uncharacterized protein n=1 Tax=Jimgerdemannia flammicorona TaxID=994334 RepID=A0A433QAZ9_9FUNG|nr:hypothetical protein BC938DRAFT_483893 [Jimgerdemannia flammicorona]
MASNFGIGIKTDKAGTEDVLIDQIYEWLELANNIDNVNDIFQHPAETLFECTFRGELNWSRDATAVAPITLATRSSSSQCRRPSWSVAKYCSPVLGATADFNITCTEPDECKRADTQDN